MREENILDSRRGGLLCTDLGTAREEDKNVAHLPTPYTPSGISRILCTCIYARQVDDGYLCSPRPRLLQLRGIRYFGLSRRVAARKGPRVDPSDIPQYIHTCPLI